MRKFYLFISILTLHLILLFRLRFTAWPEMLSFPYLLNHGFIAYKDMVHAYPPLLISILASLFKAFGYNIWVLKIFSWTTILLNDILIFLIVRKITKKDNPALFSIFIYSILEPILEGNMVWPDLFIIPFLLCGCLFLIDNKYFWSGIFFSLSLLTKQSAIFYLLAAFIWILTQKKNVKNITNYMFGVSLPILLLLFYLFYTNSFNEFVNWTIIYPSRYWTKFPGYVELSPTLRENIILLILFAPLVYFIFMAKKKL